jgi:DNA-binding LacI/PurR family transcriptional regulator
LTNKDKLDMKALTEKKLVPYQRLFNELKNQIRKGHIDGKLPSIAELTRQYSVSHNTVKKVIDRLKEQKYIYGHQGKGVFVNDALTNCPAFQKHIVLYLHVDTYRNPLYLHMLTILRGLLELEKSIVHFVNSPQQMEIVAENTDVLLIVGMIDKQEASDLENFINKEKIIQLNEPCGDYQYVSTNNFYGGYLAIEYLYEHGHRKIGLISRFLGEKCFFRERYKGAMQYAAEHPDIEVVNSVALIGLTHIIDKAARNGVESLIQQHPDITAIFAFTDILAMGAMAYCHDCGIDIPNEMSIISFDNRDFAAMLMPPLTSIQENTEGLARQVVKLIHNIIQGHHKIKNIEVKPILIERSSVKKV